MYLFSDALIELMHHHKVSIYFLGYFMKLIIPPNILFWPFKRKDLTTL